MNHTPDPTITRIEYVATYEMVCGDDVESTGAQDTKFLARLETALQPLYPNAELYLYLDGAQYTTRKDIRVWNTRSDDEFYDDDLTPLDVVEEVRGVCDDIAQTVGAEVFVSEEAEEEEELDPSWRYAVRVYESGNIIHNESADDYTSAHNRMYELAEEYSTECKLVIIDGSDFGHVYSIRGYVEEENPEN